MICPACEMGVVKGGRCVSCGHRYKPPVPEGATDPLPHPTSDAVDTETTTPVAPDDPRAKLQAAYDHATATAEAVKRVHAEYMKQRAIAEAAARQYLSLREAYVGTPRSTEDQPPPEPPAAVGPRCRRCSEFLPVPIPVRCGKCGGITVDAKTRSEARPCPTCGTPNPGDREECYACYHPMQR